MNEIFIDMGTGESRVAVIDNGELTEIFIERKGNERIVGNIYKGTVVNVLPGMQAAFIDIGLDKNAFLYVRDVLDGNYIKTSNPNEEISINKLLKRGDQILVQISKEASGTKGARVTTHISLPGKYVVLMPNVKYIGISKKIEEENERSRLRHILDELKPISMGIIARTEAEGREKSDFVEDIELQIKLWESILNDSKKISAPRLIHKDMDIVYRSIRDLFNRGTKRILINDKDAYDRGKEIIKLFYPKEIGKIEYYNESVNLMDSFGIGNKIKKALSKEVRLKSGGYIVIDQTEALTSIDVNSGKYTGLYSLKDTILLINIEAAEEIAKQLRLRDIGGIIIIDFIDMDSEEHRNKVLESLRNELKKERTGSFVFGITQLGLVEMTRKKIGKRLSSVLEKQCPMCEGTGRIMDEESIMWSIERKIECIFKETDIPAVQIEVNDSIKEYLNTVGLNYMKNIEKKYNKKVIIKGTLGLEYCDFRIKYLTGKLNFNALSLSEGDKVQINGESLEYEDSSNKNVGIYGRVESITYDEDGEMDRVTIEVGKS